jgi:hypothetical protein
VDTDEFVYRPLTVKPAHAIYCIKESPVLKDYGGSALIVHLSNNRASSGTVSSENTNTLSRYLQSVPKTISHIYPPSLVKM